MSGISKTSSNGSDFCKSNDKIMDDEKEKNERKETVI